MATKKGKIGKISMKSGHEVEWSIDKFCFYTLQDEYYESPRFTISGSEWYLKVYPNGETSEEEDCVGWISLCLMKVDANESISARYLFGVKKVNGSVEHPCSKITWVFEEAEGYGYSSFLKRSELLRRRSELLASETLTLTCTLWPGAPFEHTGNLDTLSRNLVDVISKKGSDVTLLVKGKKFPVHKLILSARSPVFAAMFEADMCEKRTGLVRIEDFDSETFEEFLKFLYSGKVENASCDYIQLFEIADKYGVEELKPEVLICIMTKLSVENVLEVAVFADQFDEDILMEKVEEFFKRNYVEIISSTKWDHLILREDATVANKLLKAMVKE